MSGLSCHIVTVRYLLAEISMTTGVSLLDQYVLLLQNVVQENRLLYREQMANTITRIENALN
jgi:hypothetical protein